MLIANQNIQPGKQLLGALTEPIAKAVEVIPLGNAQEPDGNHLATTPPAVAGNKDLEMRLIENDR